MVSRRPKPIAEISDSAAVLRKILNAIIAGHPSDYKSRSSQNRLGVAVSALTGRPLAKNTPGADDDFILELVAFDWSVAKHEGRDVTVTGIVSRLVDVLPNYCGLANKESVVRRLQRRFEANREEYLRIYSFDSEGGIPDHHRRAIEVLQILSDCKIPVEFDDPRKRAKDIRRAGRKSET